MTKPNPRQLKRDHKITYLEGNKKVTKRARDMTPMKAIRAKCLDCSDGSVTEVRECVIDSCPLYPFRFAKKPHFEGDPEKKPVTEAVKEHLRKLREAQKSNPSP